MVLLWQIELHFPPYPNTNAIFKGKPKKPFLFTTQDQSDIKITALKTWRSSFYKISLSPMGVSINSKGKVHALFKVRICGLWRANRLVIERKRENTHLGFLLYLENSRCDANFRCPFAHRHSHRSFSTILLQATSLQNCNEVEKYVKTVWPKLGLIRDIIIHSDGP